MPEMQWYVWGAKTHPTAFLTEITRCVHECPCLWVTHADRGSWPWTSTRISPRCLWDICPENLEAWHACCGCSWHACCGCCGCRRWSEVFCVLWSFCVTFNAELASLLLFWQISPMYFRDAGKGLPLARKPGLKRTPGNTGGHDNSDSCLLLHT